MSKGVRIAVMLGLLGAGAGLAGPWRNDVGGLFTKAKDKLAPKFVQVFPVSARASSSAAGTAPRLAIDKAKNTFWAENVPGPGIGQQITILFDKPTNLSRIIIRSGSQKTPQDYLKEPRPSRIRLTFSDGSVKDIALKDLPDPQTFVVDVKSATSVSLKILAVFPGQNGTATSIAEVEFFTKA